jgi:hypothetical protein
MLVGRWRETIRYGPGQVGGQKRRKLAGPEDWLHEVMVCEPDITLSELRGRLAAKGIVISRQSINAYLHALGYRYKKTTRAAEQDRADVAAKRRRWRNWQSWLKPERLVFIDETGARTNMTRLRGRSLKGQCLHAAIPWGHWKTTTFVAGAGPRRWLSWSRNPWPGVGCDRARRRCARRPCPSSDDLRHIGF